MLTLMSLCNVQVIFYLVTLLLLEYIQRETAAAVVTTVTCWHRTDELKMLSPL